LTDRLANAKRLGDAVELPLQSAKRHGTAAIARTVPAHRLKQAKQAKACSVLALLSRNPQLYFLAWKNRVANEKLDTAVKKAEKQRRRKRHAVSCGRVV
jgi:hypothetical protein